MSEETVGRHIERRTPDDGRQHWNQSLRDLPSVVLQIFEAGWTECLYRIDIQEFPEWTVAVIRDFEMENFAWSIIPRADKLAAEICGRFGVNPARLILIRQADTSWPWWVAAMLGRRTDRQYWVATAKDGEHCWGPAPADRKIVEDLLQKSVEEEGVRIWQNGEPVSLRDWRLRSSCWRSHRPVRTFKERKSKSWTATQLRFFTAYEQSGFVSTAWTRPRSRRLSARGRANSPLAWCSVAL